MIHSPRDTPAAGKAHVTTVDWPDLFSDVSSGNWNYYYSNFKKNIISYNSMSLLQNNKNQFSNIIILNYSKLN